MSTVLIESVRGWWPECILSLGALLVILAGVWTKRPQPVLAIAWASLIGAALALWCAPMPPSPSLFFGLIVCDTFSLAFRWLALGTVAPCNLVRFSISMEE